MDRFVSDFKTHKIPQVEGDGSNVILPSAGELFVFYKKCLVQCSQLSTGSSLLSLTETFQKYLKEFATRILFANMPTYVKHFLFIKHSLTVGQKMEVFILHSEF